MPEKIEPGPFISIAPSALEQSTSEVQLAATADLKLISIQLATVCCTTNLRRCIFSFAVSRLAKAAAGYRSNLV